MPIFLLSLLKNAKLMASIAAILAAFGAGIYVHSRIAQGSLERALASQQEALVAQCNKDKAITERIGNDLVKENSNLSRRVAEYKRLHKASNVSVTVPASADDGKAGGGLVGTHVVDSESLTGYAELAETYRLRLVSCQNFVRLERLQ